MNTILARIDCLKQVMFNLHISACVIPTNDPHMSEYVAEHWKARSYFSGFTGSAGTLVVTHDKVGLWTDSRYFLQAEQQLVGTDIILFRSGNLGIPSYSQWLEDNLEAGSVVAMHESVFSIEEMTSISKEFSRIELTLDTNTDLVSEVWINRPTLPEGEIFVHDIIYAGETVAQKLEKVRLKLNNKRTDTILLNALDEIAWLFNIRANDIEYNPVVIAYAAIENNSATLFVSNKKITKETESYFNENGISIKDYSFFGAYISSFKDKNILLDNTKINYAIYNHVCPLNKIVFATSPISKLKSIKNDTEVNGFKLAMQKDGAALVQFFIWLESCLKNDEKKTEILIANKLKEFRQKQENFYDESFAPIVGYQEHGAIIHYTATDKTNISIEKTGFLLIDSGGHYLHGTTDITRTINLGELSPLQKKDFTLVLKGHIALANTKFPKGTCGAQLDSIARYPLWANELNYGHGTGHGVGCFLCVHEGPQSIRPDQNRTILEKGMILSNEPGIYRPGEYGIRIENLLLIREIENNSESAFLYFETLTLFPIDISAIDGSLMLRNEIDWLNNYHQMVYDRLSPFLSADEKNWLANKCQKLC